MLPFLEQQKRFIIVAEDVVVVVLAISCLCVVVAIVAVVQVPSSSARAVLLSPSILNFLRGQLGLGHRNACLSSRADGRYVDGAGTCSCEKTITC